MLDRPAACRGCQLDAIATGFAPASGLLQSPLNFLGESLGKEEVREGRGFVGPAGTILNRAFRMAGVVRENIRVSNLINCQPPKNELDGRSYEHAAIAHCRQAYLQPDIEAWLKRTTSPNPVLVALGAVPLRNMLDLPKKGVRVQDFHGTVSRDPSDRFWVVPSYHPSFIQRGAFNLLSTLVFDITQAMEVSQQGFVRDETALILDPEVAWFEMWANNYLAACAQDPERVWLAVDIETPDKAKQADEGELTTTKDRSFHIIRVNFSCNVGEGITVPFQGPYITIIQRLMASKGPKIFWGYFYDGPRFKHARIKISGPILDFMWAWHKLQSDHPRGLGYVSPFYSNFGPWKHLSGTEPVLYAAIDGVQTLRCAHGIAADLQQLGMWDSFWTHVYELDTYCLWPSEETGFLVDKEELARMKVDLEEKRLRFYGEIQALVPEESKRLAPKDGWTRPPTDEEIEALNQTRARKEEPLLIGSAIEAKVKRLVKVCLTCSKIEIAKTHRCEDRSMIPSIDLQEIEVSRWFIREEFNPGSAPQLLTYILTKGHRPGVNKKTKRPTTDKATLGRLVKQEAKKKSGDKLYSKILMFREVTKVETTYVDGTYRRLENDPRSIVDGRLHPTTGHKPSTQRLSMQGPNLQNVIADRRGKEALAAGFRKVLIAVDEEGEPQTWQGFSI